jgi:hypothetical protein
VRVKAQDHWGVDWPNMAGWLPSDPAMDPLGLILKKAPTLGPRSEHSLKINSAEGAGRYGFGS